MKEKNSVLFGRYGTNTMSEKTPVRFIFNPFNRQSA